MKNISDTLKYLRNMNGYSQSYIAKVTGISQQKISYYESGKHSPSMEDCVKLADFYGLSLDELVGRIFPKDNIQNN